MVEKLSEVHEHLSDFTAGEIDVRKEAFTDDPSTGKRASCSRVSHLLNSWIKTHKVSFKRKIEMNSLFASQKVSRKVCFGFVLRRVRREKGKLIITVRVLSGNQSSEWGHRPSHDGVTQTVA
eukprot:GHVO01012438.1.p1 GENE.GHVO01012438.1~~GHVO01012438.1.p1  ORF type:complete len:122 (+),score=0.86 GHVO01012438.1:402-767(+)